MLNLHRSYRTGIYANKFRVFIILFSLFCCAIWANPLFAQTMLDSALSTSIGGNNTVGSIKPPPPIATIMQDLQAQGFTNISPLAPTTIGTPMQATAMSPAGIPVNLVIDPQTGKLLAATPQ